MVLPLLGLFLSSISSHQETVGVSFEISARVPGSIARWIYYGRVASGSAWSLEPFSSQINCCVEVLFNIRRCPRIFLPRQGPSLAHGPSPITLIQTDAHGCQYTLEYYKQSVRWRLYCACGCVRGTKLDLWGLMMYVLLIIRTFLVQYFHCEKGDRSRDHV